MIDMNMFTNLLSARVFPTPPVPFAAASLASAHFAVPRVHLVFSPSLDSHAENVENRMLI